MPAIGSSRNTCSENAVVVIAMCVRTTIFNGIATAKHFAKAVLLIGQMCCRQHTQSNCSDMRFPWTRLTSRRVWFYDQRLARTFSWYANDPFACRNYNYVWCDRGIGCRFHFLCCRRFYIISRYINTRSMRNLLGLMRPIDLSFVNANRIAYNWWGDRCWQLAV